MHWARPEVALPLSRSTSMGPLATCVSSGLLRGAPEQGQDRLLVRYGRNQVSPTNINLALGPGHWALELCGTPKVSYTQLDSITREHFVAVVASHKRSSAAGLAKVAEDGLKRVLQAVRAAEAAPGILALLLRTGRPSSRQLVVRPVRVARADLAHVPPSLEAGIQVWGSDMLRDRMKRELRGEYDPNSYQVVQPEVRAILSTTVVFNRLVKSKAGPFRLVSPPSRVISQAQLALSVSGNVFRGLSTVTPGLNLLIAELAASSKGPMEFPPTPELLTYGELLAGLSIGKVYTRRAVSVPDGDLKALWGKAPGGWFTSGPMFVRLKRAGRRLRVAGAFTWESFGVLTMTKDHKQYTHLILGVTGPVPLREIEGVPEWVRSNSPAILKPGYRSKSRSRDVVHVVESAAQTTVLLEPSPWSVNASCEAYTVGLRRRCPEGLGKAVDSTHELPTMQDAVVCLSGGRVSVLSARAKAAAGLAVSLEALSSMAAEFATQAILSEALLGRIEERPDVAPDWLSAASRMQNVSAWLSAAEDMVVPREDPGEVEVEPDWLDAHAGATEEELEGDPGGDPDWGALEDYDARNMRLLAELMKQEEELTAEAGLAYDGLAHGMEALIEDGLALLGELDDD